MVGGEVAQREEALAEEAAPARGLLLTKTNKDAPTGGGLTKTYQTGQYWHCGEGGTPQEKLSNVKRQGATQIGDAWTVKKP